MFIHNNSSYYFWDKQTQSIGRLYVKAIHKDYFEFTYKRKRYKATYEYANGRLFSAPDRVPTPADYVFKDIDNLDSSIDDDVSYDC